jgi:hypothetical protein
MDAQSGSAELTVPSKREEYGAGRNMSELETPAPAQFTLSPATVHARYSMAEANTVKRWMS